MKRSKIITWDQLRVGLLIIAGIAIAVVAIVRLGTATGLFADRYKLITFLPNASGLVEGGQVTVAGQMAGVIERIEFLPVDFDTTRNLRITMGVDRALSAQIRENSRVRIRTLGLLGDRVIDISPGTPPFRALREGDTLVVDPAVDYEALLVQAASVMDDVVRITADLRLITGGVARGEGTLGQLVTNRAVYDQLNVALARTSSLMTRLQTPHGTFGRMIDDPALYQHAVTTLASLDTVLTQLNSADGTLGRLMRDETLYVSLVETVEGANELLRRFTDGEGTAARLVNDPALYDELVKAVSDLNAILEDVRRDPQRYTRGLIRVF